MKIVKLIAENVKRLHAVSITPEGALVTIGGKNGAGKSSVLDSIAYAMGGEKLVPSEPIRTGESEAKIVVDLGDLVVTRKFRREKIVTPAKILSAQPGDVAPETTAWGDTTSTLTVTNKDGAKYPSPQAVLDKLLGRLTFDPLAFARDEPRRQDETLRKLVGLDVTPIEARRKAAFDQRAMLKKTHAIKAAQLAALPFHKDAPAEEVSMDAVSSEMLEAERLRKVAEEAERVISRHKDTVNSLTTTRAKFAIHIGEANKRIKELQDSLVKLDSEQATIDIRLDDTTNEVKIAEGEAQAARAAVPDVDTIRRKLADVEVANGKVRTNQKHATAVAEVASIDQQWKEQELALQNADMEKKAALAAASFPVVGLGLSDDGVTFNGLPFDQAGSAEQVRVSVAIGIALNPQLKVLLIRNGNLLDEDSFAAVVAQAETADMQVWMEWVSATKDGVAVMMVDGEVA